MVAAAINKVYFNHVTDVVTNEAKTIVILQGTRVQVLSYDNEKIHPGTSKVITQCILKYAGLTFVASGPFRLRKFQLQIPLGVPVTWYSIKRKLLKVY